LLKSADVFNLVLLTDYFSKTACYNSENSFKVLVSSISTCYFSNLSYCFLGAVYLTS